MGSATEIQTVLWREWVFFRRRFWKITSSLIVSPILYMVAFGWGIGQGISVDGMSYMYYIVPGIIALTSMRAAYGAISMRISVTRLHEQSFEAYLSAPVSMAGLTMGHILAGGLRGSYAGLVILAVSYACGVWITVTPLFICVLLLNSLLFSALGFFAAMMIDTHYDMNRFSSFVITPMAFLCGTFFSLKKLPWFVRDVIEWLPLTHSTRLIRAIAMNGRVEEFSVLVLLIYVAIFTALSIRACYEEVV